MPMIPGMMGPAAPSPMGATMGPAIPGAPPAPMMGAPFPSLDPTMMMQALAPVAAMQQADQLKLQAQQDALTTTLLDAMKGQPNPAAQAAMVEPGEPTSALGAPPATSLGDAGY